MYQQAYGIIETQAPLHVGASAGEEAGNLNLIFRDQFTQTGIIPGSSIRGRFRTDMRSDMRRKNEDHNYWYGHEAIIKQKDGGTTEAQVKFEYASLVWLPVFCPGQPIVWVSCPRLLTRYKAITGQSTQIPQPYSAPRSLQARPLQNQRKILFFNLGFLEIEHEADLSSWLPPNTNVKASQLVIVADNDMAMIHDMTLYRQSRVAIEADQKKAKEGSFFNVEALPEGSVLIFPIAIKKHEKNTKWRPFHETLTNELYFGGLESIGFGRCQVNLAGKYFQEENQ